MHQICYNNTIEITHKQTEIYGIHHGKQGNQIQTVSDKRTANIIRQNFRMLPESMESHAV